MWSFPLLGVFIFQIIPFTIFIIILLKILKIMEKVTSAMRDFSGMVVFRNSLPIIPYAVIAVIIIYWLVMFFTELTLGYSGGEFHPIDVYLHLTDSSTFIIGTALPLCMAMILIYGILDILAYNYIEWTKRFVKRKKVYR